MKSGMAKLGNQSGFTLVEVVLAILVVALGVLSVFTLFPSGLRASEDTVADTRAGMFAESVFGQMRGGADGLVQWSDWSIPDVFKLATTSNLVVNSANPQTVQFPDLSGQKLRYRLTIDLTDTVRYPTKLEVCDGEYGSFQFQSVFYTEFVYKGM